MPWDGIGDVYWTTSFQKSQVRRATTRKRSCANDSAFANCRKGPCGGATLCPRKSLNHRGTKIRSTSLAKSGKHGRASGLP
ncbi:hypothetical protein HYE68_005199 [Fusarium pseudograminearum]|uniref:Uncharacterized protein n=1 Tax=Fusarium pseudograminearum (strain CS3096) TaxID=1028729 RepID=K3VVC0_FUSPC|nr:hypothetical protein FPSE_01770 [Fusarium pseudograminearum CS3096]EKJ78308.1 hypothetical protein FPSE_01770 [Fusarium pseudograminearum CS3096]QPC74447.1 hypothetical protein HYE68_005199 [Fusarium pseudograminearum]